MINLYLCSSMIGALDILFLSVALAMDCFSVSIVCGVVSGRWRSFLMLRMAFLFGFFQALMPLVGWLCTNHFSSYIETIDHWIAFGLLLFLGIRMIRESADNDKGKGKYDDKTLNFCKLGAQLVFSVATSIDAFAVGISFACLGYSSLADLFWPLVAIGIGSFVFSIVGCLLGILFGFTISKRLRPSLFGGIVLILIGIKILLTHLLE